MGQRSSRPIGKQMILLADLIDDLEAGLPALLPPLDSLGMAHEFPVSAVGEDPEGIPEMGTTI
jgi:hypothetical protein